MSFISVVLLGATAAITAPNLQGTAPSQFALTCLASGGAASTVGDDPRIVAMTIYNAQGITGTTSARSFVITAAPNGNTESYVMLTRNPAPNGEENQFRIREGQSAILFNALLVKVTSVTFTNLPIELCIKPL